MPAASRVMLEEGGREMWLARQREEALLARTSERDVCKKFSVSVSDSVSLRLPVSLFFRALPDEAGKMTCSCSDILHIGSRVERQRVRPPLGGICVLQGLLASAQ